MFSVDRAQLRQQFIDAWQKARAGEQLEPVQRQIVDVVQRHPEYQPLLEQREQTLGRDWHPEGGETNPFLHMGLHIALLEQVTTDRPPGIRALYQRMIEACLGDTHDAEHRILECLAEEIWQVQRTGGDLRVKRYLKCIKRQGAGRRPRSHS